MTRASLHRRAASTDLNSNNTEHTGMTEFSGLGLHLGNLSRLSNAKTRSISPENFTGEKGKGGMSTDGPAANAARGLGQGWKVSPYILIEPGETFTLADIEGARRDPADLDDAGARQVAPHDPARLLGRPGAAVDRMPGRRFLRLRLGDTTRRSRRWRSASIPAAPSTATGRCRSASARGSRWKISATSTIYVYYQINYTLTDVPDDCAYFHAQFRRTNPLPYKEVYTILDGVKGRGHYVGTYMAWGVNNAGWWGEGEIKFFMDGDKEFPTICGTGTEDYFCGAYNFDPGTHRQARSPGGSRPMSSSPRPMPACRRSSGRTGSTHRSSASACIAGTSWIRSASRATCG